MQYRHCLQRLKNILETIFDMKRNIVFLALAMVLMLIVGCEETQPTRTESVSTCIDTLSQDLKRHLVKQDSLSKELLQKIDTLTIELNSAKAETESLKNSIAEQNNPNFLWDVLPLIIGIISLLIALVVGFCTRHDLEKDEVYGIINQHLNKLGLDRNFRDKIQSFMNNYSLQKSTKVVQEGSNYLLENKVASLEKEIAELKKARTTISATQNVVSKGESISPTSLYANMNSQEYFTDVVTSNQGTCVFVIRLVSQTKGDFDIISLDKIKQRNGWERIVDYKGDCTINEAKDFKTDRKGKCEKLSDGTWKVVENLKITIYK